MPNAVESKEFGSDISDEDINCNGIDYSQGFDDDKDGKDIWDQGSSCDDNNGEECDFLEFTNHDHAIATPQKTSNVKCKNTKCKVQSPKTNKRKKRKRTRQCNGRTPKAKMVKTRQKDDDVDRSPNKRGTNGWEESLRQLPATVQHYQVAHKVRSAWKNEGTLASNSSPNKKPRNPCAREMYLESPPDSAPGSPNTQERKRGEFVWAKFFNSGWWPALVVSADDIGQVPLDADQQWVFWFGDRQISQVPTENMVDFVQHFGTKYSAEKAKTIRYKRSVSHAIHTCAMRIDVPIVDSFSVCLKWANDGFPHKTDVHHPFAPNPDDPIPENMKSFISSIKAIYVKASENQEVCYVPPSTGDRDQVIKRVKNGELKMEDICVACGSIGKDVVVAQHPLISGGLCDHCKREIRDTMFAYGDDGTSVLDNTHVISETAVCRAALQPGSTAFCIVCANPGDLAICDNGDCSSVICSPCIELLVGPGTTEEVLKQSPWSCFICTEYDAETHGVIKRKANSKENIVNFFRNKNYFQNVPEGYFEKKRNIRVLSLFDGIGTGRYCLDQLGFDVEVYYAAEICPNAINVALVNNPNKIIQLGAIEDLNYSRIRGICPIDLVIGGSPCNDLSLVNPARKGLFDQTGTGNLVFEFHRVLTDVRFANQELAKELAEKDGGSSDQHYVFFLFENVASMPHQYRDTISRFFECEPAMIDSKHFSAQNRPRYFWGNIPGLYSVLPKHLLGQEVKLGDVLMPGLNRVALVNSVRTVTTRSNSLKQKKECVYPVVMNGEFDTLWTTELEKLFGFPAHYTDVGNLQNHKRNVLLGKSWSVPVICHIFLPLKNLFKLKEATKNPS